MLSLLESWNDVQDNLLTNAYFLLLDYRLQLFQSQLLPVELVFIFASNFYVISQS